MGAVEGGGQKPKIFMMDKKSAPGRKRRRTEAKMFYSSRWGKRYNTQPIYCKDMTKINTYGSFQKSALLYRWTEIYDTSIHQPILPISMLPISPTSCLWILITWKMSQGKSQLRVLTVVIINCFGPCRNPHLGLCQTPKVVIIGYIYIQGSA